MKILAIHAHPDDIEFFCAGTLALLKQNGHEIHLATMTAGDKGSMTTSMEDTAAIRTREAARAAEVLDAPYTCLGFNDYEVFDDDASRRRVTEFLRTVKPDIVLTASPTDYHADHEYTSLLARYATFVIGIPNYKTGPSPIVDHIPALYYMDPAECKNNFGQPVVPDFIVNVASAIDIKQRMLACHESQREWLRVYHGMDRYLEEMIRFSKQRGETYGIPYGEGFRQHRGAAYPQKNLLAECLPKDKIVFP